jgi:hypothetical protein
LTSTSPYPWTETSEREKYMPAGINPMIGFVLGLVGGIIIVVDAVVALLIGDVLTGIIGIVFFILILAFAVVGYASKQHEMKLVSSMFLMILGFVIMILAPVLISPFEFTIIVIAIVGGLLTVFGGILMIPRKA